MIGTKIERQSDAQQHPRPRHEPEAEIAVHVGHAVHRERDQHRAGDDQVFGLHLGRQTADDEHHHHRNDAARREHETGPGRGVAEILLHQLRQELGGREQDGAGREHHQEASAELAARHHPQVDDRIGAGQSPRNHQNERQSTR